MFNISYNTGLCCSRNEIKKFSYYGLFLFLLTFFKRNTYVVSVIFCTHLTNVCLKKYEYFSSPFFNIQHKLGVGRNVPQRVI